MISAICGTTPDNAPPQKLSKPPTNTSSSNLLAPIRQRQEPVSPLTASDESADGYFPSMPAHGERKERHNRRSKIKSYLYGPSPESGHSHSSDDDESSPRRFAQVVKRRLSRTDSGVSQSLTVGATSAASSSSRLHLPDTSSSDFDEHDAVKEQIKEKVWIDTLAAQNHVSTPIDEDKHPDSVKSPIRRRSLYTPGIATRSPEDILRKPPPPAQIRSQADRDYYYNPALPDSSPLSRLANLRSLHNGRSTPSELDYSHLGAIQLGTLRVTNGTASPVPHELDSKTAPASSLNTTSYGSYYEPSDGDKSDPKGCLTMGDVSTNPWPRSHYDALSTETSLAGVTEYVVFRPDQVPSESEMRSRYGSEMGSFTSVRSLTASQHLIKRKPLPSMSPAVQQDRPRDETARPISGSCSDHSPTESQPYLDRSIPHTPMIQADATEHKKSGPVSNQESQPEPLNPAADQLVSNKESREDAFLKLTKNEKARQELSGVHDTCQNPLEEFPFDQQHVDSGYSSNVSLGSTQMPTLKAALDLGVPPKEQVILQSPCYHFPQKSWELKPTGYSQDSEASRIDPQLNHELQHFSTMQSRPSPNGEKDKYPPIVGSERSTIQKQTPGPEKPRRLQKKRPKSQPPLHRSPMLSVASLSDTNIPPVPTGIAARCSERVAEFPSIDYTYPDIRHTDGGNLSGKPASTNTQTHFPSPTHGAMDSQPKDGSSIFQKLALRSRSKSRSRPRVMQSPDHSDDESAKSDIMRSPSWSDYGNTRKKEQRKKARAERELQKQKDRESSCDPDARSRSKSRSRSRFRSRSRKRSSQGGPVPTLTDFGTVSESLGAGPYDIAIASHTANQQSPHNDIQPYQINTANQRGTPVASTSPFEHGRHRSHTSAAVGLDNSISASPRPDRPRSMYFESRPVPAMAMADLTQRRSALSETDSQGMISNAQTTNTIQQTSSETSCRRSKTGQEAGSNLSVKQEDESQQNPSSSLAPTKIETMEELVDKLLEAPGHEEREIILQQMRELRPKSKVERKIGSQRADKKTDSPSTKDAEGSVDQPTPVLGSTQQQQTQKTEVEEAQAVKGKNNDHHRHHSMLVDAPPMPPLPTAKDIHQQETRRSMEQSRRNKTLVGPQMPALEPTKADLWAGGAIQSEHRKAIESSNGWDAHRLAWSRRRKSAGEALFVQNRFPGMTPPKTLEDTQREEERPRVMPRAMTAGLGQPVVAEVSQKAFHRPWMLSQGQNAPGDNLAGVLQSNSRVAATAQTFERRSGRYEGGLSFGYEKGFGLGGSAGTRSATKTGATRKSLQMSQGYGVDLSDVPIFVAPSN
ncbi:MAG: hypothetical protein LQ337_000142 [Flavoplaca oasis]|nr:MAG: hypothetical protein LQ337_000142 [Flavoplaca oasis]